MESIKTDMDTRFSLLSFLMDPNAMLRIFDNFSFQFFSHGDRFDDAIINFSNLIQTGYSEFLFRSFVFLYFHARLRCSIVKEGLKILAQYRVLVINVFLLIC